MPQVTAPPGVPDGQAAELADGEKLHSKEKATLQEFLAR
jgi:hypothetical protein